MTEDEAKTKACCGPSIVAADDNGGNCVASACMAWRWELWRDERGLLYRHPESDDGPLDPAQGHCGLAGAPQ